MKTLNKTAVLALIVAALAGCTSRTEYGECVGIADDKNPRLTYKLSTWNTFLAVVGFQFIAPPIIILANETFCPVGLK